MAASFEWDFDKDAENQAKHGVSFGLAQEAFFDPQPSPEQLVAGEEGIKVTISLSRRSVAFFKEAAERNHTSYQRMIRRLLDLYADQYWGDLN